MSNSRKPSTGGRAPGLHGPTHRVERFHEAILSAVTDHTPLSAHVCSLLAIAPEQPLERAQLERLKARFAKSLATDLTADQVEDVATPIYRRLEVPGPPETYRHLFDRIEEVYRAMAKRWSRLLISFVHSVIENCRRRGVEELLFLARDGIPFFVICRRLQARGHWDGRVSLADVNRTMARKAFRDSVKPAPPQKRKPFPGSLSASDCGETLLHAYLRWLLGERGRVAFVETGVYGTLIKLMLETRVLEDPLVFFFASKNPNIFGYLNLLLPRFKLEGTKTLYEFAGVCCDTVETWPKLYTPGALDTGADGITATAKLMDPLSVAANLALCRALASECDRIDLSDLDPHEELLSLYKMSQNGAHEKGELPLVLPSPVPNWKHGSSWCKAWNLGPLPPMDEILGPTG